MTSIDGTEGNDALQGSDSEDVLNGLGGSDLLIGGAGKDSINGGEGDDTLIGNRGDDALRGGAGTDVLFGDEGSDRYLFGLGWGDDVIFNTPAFDSAEDVDAIEFDADILPEDISVTRQARDIILTHVNGDTITLARFDFTSGNRIDEVRFDDGTVWTADDLMDMSNPGTEGDDEITGTSGDDILYGLGGEDQISGNDGDDIIDGGADDDRIFGQDGNDTLSGGTGNDTIYGDGGDDLIDGGAGNDTVFAGNGDDIIDGGAGDDDLTGGAGNDVYRFDLGWGNDTISLFQGNGNESDRDIIEFGEGIFLEDFTVSASADDRDLVLSHTGGDTLTLKDFFFFTTFQAGEARFADGTVIAPRDLIITALGTEDDDTLNGIQSGTWREELIGGLGDDILRGFAGDDFLFGGGGRDTLQGGSGNDLVDGGADGDQVFGDAGNDEVLGGSGNDQLYGGDDDDLLTGGEGNDQLRGEEGTDTYFFELGWGEDIIYNFDTAETSSEGPVRAWDAIVFGEGIAQEDFTGYREGDDLILIHSSGDLIVVDNHYLSFDHEVTYIDFSDGTSWGVAVLDYVRAQDPGAVTIDEGGVGLQVSGAGFYQITDGIATFDLSYLGVVMGPQTSPGWQALAAGAGDVSAYSVLWQSTAGTYSVWNTDATGGFVGVADVSNLVDFEDRFQFDFNGDNVIGHTVIAFDGTGIGLQSSTQGGYQIVDGDQTFDLNYLGVVMGPETSPGWQALAAGVGDVSAYSVLWQSTAGTYSVWNTDATGGFVGVADISNLVDFEDRFQFDLNGDNVIGHTVTEIDGIGIGLQSSTRGMYQIVDGEQTFDLSYLGVVMGPQTSPGWQALAAGAGDVSAYSVLWQSTAGTYSVWNTDATGGFVGVADISDLVDFEDRFQFDFNGDNVIGHTVIAFDGTGIGLQSSTQGGYQIVDGEQTFDLSYLGVVMGPQTSPGWQALAAGAGDVSAYSVLWQSTAGTYSVWNTDATGGFVGVADISDLVDFEDRFQFDFNGDNVIGHTVIAFDGTGIGLQSSTQGGYQIVDGEQTFDLSYLGVVMGPQTSPGWQALAAGAGDVSAYSVLWQSTAGTYSVWNTDATGGFVGVADISDLVDFEDRFQFDFNGDNVIGHTVTEIDGIGIGLQSSTRGMYQVVDGDQTFDLSYLGVVTGPETSPGWQALAAGVGDVSAYSVLWQNTAGAYTIWNTDATGAYLSSADISNLVNFEDRFQFDFNGDGLFLG